MTKTQAQTSRLLIGLIAAAMLASGCSSSYVKATSARNPPPLEAFRNFDRFEVEPITMQAPYAGQAGNEAAKLKMQSYIDEQLKPLLAKWNAQPAQHSPERTLQIAPQVRDIRFIHGAGRVLGGTFGGNSAVVMDVRFTDAATSAQVAKAEFYSQANAFAGGYSFGVADNIMLIRPPTLLTEYVKANYDAAVGGRTSAEGAK